MTYTMSTKQVEEGLLISFTDVVAHPVTGTAPGSETALASVQEFIAKLSSNLPSYVIARDGSFLRIDGLSEYQARLKSTMQEMLAVLPNETQAVLKQSGILNDQSMAAQTVTTITDEWNISVGVWIDATLERGAIYESESTANVPMFGNLPIPIKLQFEFLGRTACNENDSDRGCVELMLRSFPDPEKTGAAIESFLSHFAKQRGQDVAIESMDQTMEVRLITEPDSLLPHRVHKLRNTSIMMVVDGNRQSGEQREEVTYQFRY